MLEKKPQPAPENLSDLPQVLSFPNHDQLTPPQIAQNPDKKPQSEPKKTLPPISPRYSPSPWISQKVKEAQREKNDQSMWDKVLPFNFFPFFSCFVDSSYVFPSFFRCFSVLRNLNQMGGFGRPNREA
ncbi:hypothetical protein COCNU_contig68915436G000010 [Cocos nucifera]|nr:hypothetical protein [Cocos nucifera]